MFSFLPNFKTVLIVIRKVSTMKKIVTLLFLVVSLSYGQTDNLTAVITPNIPQSISDIFFVNAQKGWLVGNSGMIMISTDGGVTWTAQNSGVTTNLQRVVFVNDQVGYIGMASRASILRTSDGGATWNLVSLPAADTARTSYAICFLSPSTGFVGCGKSAASDIFMTSDSGKTWASKQSITSNYFTDISFGSPTRGVAVANIYSKLYYTTDGGSTWSLSTKPSSMGTASYSSSVINTVKMVDSLTVVASGWGSWYSLQPTIVLRSTDGGATYVYQSASGASNTYGSGYDVYFKDANNGLIVGNQRGGVVLKTTDAGATWNPITVFTAHPLRSIAGSGDTVWIASYYGVFRSTDFGSTWTLLTPNSQEQIMGLQFFSSSVGYLTSSYGIMRKTADGGKTWNYFGAVNPGIAGNVVDYLNGVQFYDANFGIAAHNYGSVSRTTDGGSTWSVAVVGDSSSSTAAKSVFALSTDKAYAVRTKASATYDQFLTLTGYASAYTKRDTALKVAPNDVAFYDDNRGIIVGSSGVIRYTKNGGTTWTTATVSGLPAGNTLSSNSIYAVQIIDSLNTWASGTKVLLKSTDLGQTWTYVAPNITVSDSVFYTLGFRDKNLGYVGGYKGALSKTTDGGSTWTQITDIDAAQAIRKISFDKSGNTWIGTGSGIVYSNTATTGIVTGSSAPRTFSLAQNYPNPFNPTTVISFQLAAQENVSLKIYNILGKEIASLVHGTMNAGSYSVPFDANRLSSGIYFYTLKAGARSETKKMMLLK
jgi:photosystem II stability/assembly factor-like uncharacterized protein